MFPSTRVILTYIQIPRLFLSPFSFSFSFTYNLFYLNFAPTKGKITFLIINMQKSVEWIRNVSRNVSKSVISSQATSNWFSVDFSNSIRFFFRPLSSQAKVFPQYNSVFYECALHPHGSIEIQCVAVILVFVLVFLYIHIIVRIFCVESW